MAINVRGQCPGALAPMQTGDGLLVRLKPEGNLLSGSQCAEIGRLAKTFGNGTLDLTRRANLQLRGIRLADQDALIGALREHSLVDATASAEARRNIILSPFAGADGHELADNLAAALCTSKLTLPGKFGFAIDTGDQPVLKRESADIRIERAADQRLLIRADGMQLGIAVSKDRAVATAIKLAEWFVTTNMKLVPTKRMASLIAEGNLPEGALRGRLASSPSRCPPLPGERTDEGLFVGAEFGQISADTLISLAPFAPLMLTPWRMLLIKRPDAALQNGDRGNLRAVINLIDDLIIESDDARLHVVACVGAPACDQGLQSTRPLARELADALAAGLSRSNTLHVSGCEKGCACHKVANLTLVGASVGFDAIIDGNTFATPNYRAIPANVSGILATIAPTKQVTSVQQTVCNHDLLNLGCKTP